MELPRARVVVRASDLARGRRATGAVRSRALLAGRAPAVAARLTKPLGARAIRCLRIRGLRSTSGDRNREQQATNSTTKEHARLPSTRRATAIPMFGSTHPRGPSARVCHPSTGRRLRQTCEYALQAPRGVIFAWTRGMNTKQLRQGATIVLLSSELALETIACSKDRHDEGSGQATTTAASATSVGSTGAWRSGSPTRRRFPEQRRRPATLRPRRPALDPRAVCSSRR